MSDEHELSPETDIALLKHRLKVVEDELAAMKAWGLKGALGILGALFATYWDKFQNAVKALAR